MTLSDADHASDRGATPAHVTHVPVNGASDGRGAWTKRARVKHCCRYGPRGLHGSGPRGPLVLNLAFALNPDPLDLFGPDEQSAHNLMREPSMRMW